MNYGLMSVVTVAGGLATALLWSMSANDPYWRLVETNNVPAPAYQGGADLRALLATVPLEFGNTDAGAMNPALGSFEIARRPEVSFEDFGHNAENASIDQPMIALESSPLTGSQPDALITLELPRGADPVPADFGANADYVVASVPQTLPAPMLLRDLDAGVVATSASASTLDLFVVPDSPAQPYTAASEETEQVLALQRSGRVDVQRRLALAGFDPSGVDGVFGQRTRAAITDFQTAWGFPATGYLDNAVIADLNQRTEDAYRAQRRQAAAARIAPAPVAAVREPQLAAKKGACARNTNGRIIEHQSIGCDIAGFGESFVSLGRNTLEYGADGTAAAIAPVGTAAQAER